MLVLPPQALGGSLVARASGLTMKAVALWLLLTLLNVTAIDGSSTFSRQRKMVVSSSSLSCVNTRIEQHRKTQAFVRKRRQKC